MATLGITEQSGKKLDIIIAHFGFNQEKDAALFSFAYALYAHLEVPQVSKKITKWTVDTFKDAELENLIELLYPHYDIDKRKSFTIVEDLMDAGICELSHKIEQNPEIKITELIPSSRG